MDTQNLRQVFLFSVSLKVRVAFWRMVNYRQRDGKLFFSLSLNFFIVTFALSYYSKVIQNIQGSKVRLHAAGSLSGRRAVDYTEGQVR